MVRRLFDVAFSVAGLLLLLPVFAGIAVMILLDDGPPVCFRQRRVGAKGKLFRIWKFRSMRGSTGGSTITAAGDPRVTRVGRWLRELKLDELPQLVNVLTGDMSLIGPRPEVPEFVKEDDPLWRAVLEVRPGITDVASLIYRDEEAILGASEDPAACYSHIILPAKLRINLAHIRSRSFWRDLRLIVLTIKYSFFPASFDRRRAGKILDLGVEKS
jgi:lipopolysaccharide/colanic/teichoic acid biosynthesis glycosyltransferase